MSINNKPLDSPEVYKDIVRLIFRMLKNVPIVIIRVLGGRLVWKVWFGVLH